MTLDPGQELPTHDQVIQFGIAYQSAYIELRNRIRSGITRHRDWSLLEAALGDTEYHMMVRLEDLGVDATTAEMLAYGPILDR